MFEYALAKVSYLFVGDKKEKGSIHHKACASGEPDLYPVASFTPTVVNGNYSVARGVPREGQTNFAKRRHSFFILPS